MRKSALQLLKTCLIYNPFGAQVSEYPLVQKVNSITDETVFLLLFLFSVCVLYIPKAPTGSQVPIFFYFILLYIYIFIYYISQVLCGQGMVVLAVCIIKYRLLGFVVYFPAQFSFQET